MKTTKKSILFISSIITFLSLTMCNTVKETSNLNQNDFVPDTIYEPIFPWRCVEECFNHRLSQHQFKDSERCPLCGLKSEKLIWIQYNSPPITWRLLCGRKGPLSICPKCRIQVEFIVEMMN
jgi:hypothetical protein